MQEPTYRIEAPMTAELRNRIERWRSRQSVIPTRAEAVRRLVEAGLAAGDAPAAGAVPSVPAVGPGDGVPPFPTGDLPGTRDLNVEIPMLAYRAIEWVCAVRGASKKAVVADLLLDGARRLARERGALPG
jgi:hypothetical protein